MSKKTFVGYKRVNGGPLEVLYKEDELELGNLKVVDVVKPVVAKEPNYGKPNAEKCTIMSGVRFEDFMDGVKTEAFMSLSYGVSYA